MTGKFRKSFALILILALCGSILGGCGSEAGETSGETLWVLTEQSTPDGMNYQAEMIAERMMEADSGLTVQLEILPNDTQQREIALKKLRAQIMAGKGPDVYLLPTGSSLILDYTYQNRRWDKRVQVEPLFRDVPLAMRGGLFADLQPYFQEDGLKEEIMDAGVLEGKRYVLPLRYTVPVILTAPEDWLAFGLNADLLNAGVEALAAEALSREDPALATGLQLPGDMSLLPALTDGETGELALTASGLGDYMRLYQATEAAALKERERLIEEYHQYFEFLVDKYIEESGVLNARDHAKFVYGDFRSFNNLQQYSQYDISWRKSGLPLFVCPLADALNTLAIGKLEETEMRLFPLRAMDGAVVADVTYYGAVGSSCKNPELAYAFLRQFLTEEFQWDLYRPRINKNTQGEKRLADSQTLGQVENSWPVRTEGATSYLWDSLRYQCRGLSVSHLLVEKSKVTSRKLQEIRLSDEDLPALSWPIDRVRFPVTLPEEESFEHALSLLNNEDGTPTDVDIDNLSQQVYQKLWFHVMEG